MILGIGMDLAEVARYDFTPEQRAWFARKVYTEEEMRYALSKRRPQEHLAGFFAAKEAVRKAFGRALPWRDVGVTHECGGKPVIVFDHQAAELSRARGVKTIHLTITHTETNAAAFVVLEG